ESPSRGHGRAHRAAADRVHASRPRRRWTASVAAFALAGAALFAVVGLEMRRHSDVLPVTIALTDGQQRGTSVIVVDVPDAAEIRLQAEVDGDDEARYALSIDDRVVARELRASRVGAYRFVEAMVRADALAAGSHRVRVVADDASQAQASWTLTTRSR